MNYWLLSIVSLILFTSVPPSLLAQEKEATLEEVVVTATRDVQEIRKVPANVTVITEEEISQSNARFVVDLLRDEVGVLVRDFYGTGKNATVDIRGFGETGPLNTLVLVDGRRANAMDLSGVDWTQIPLDQIERIEIVRGASSVLYGDNAVGGVVNIITKRPEKTLSAGAQGALGSYHYHKESGSVGGKWGPLSAMLNAGYQATEGYRDNGFFRAKDVGGKVIYDLNEQISLNVNAGFHRDDSGLPGGLPKPIYEQDRRATISPNDKAETDDLYLTSGVKVKLREMGRIEADLSYRHREVSDFFRSYDFEDRRNLTTWGFVPQYILDKPLWGHGHKLTAGLDYYSSDSNVDSEYVLSGTVFYDGLEIKKKSTGLYVLDEFSILENLIFSVGGRYEWVNYKVHQTSTNKKDEVRDAEPAWTLGLDYLFGQKSSAFLSAKRSFRFPVSDELIQFFPVFQANPLMKPQVGYDYEAGIRHAFSDVQNLALDPRRDHLARWRRRSRCHRGGPAPGERRPGGHRGASSAYPGAGRRIGERQD